MSFTPLDARSVVDLVEEDRLDTDAAYRFKYFSKCIGFTSDDIQRLKDNETYLANVIENAVFQVFTKVLEDDSSKKVLMSRFHGYDGPLVTDIDEMNIESEIIVHRMRRYREGLISIFKGSWSDDFVCTLALLFKKGWGNEVDDSHDIHNSTFSQNLRNELTRIILVSNEDNMHYEEQIKLVLTISKVISVLTDLRQVKTQE